ncbi:hypothetical protein RFI_02407 [Reticulomyxa filosa]|uniref:Uncharacterized protein n=1 Tax=Reticulomyxa filosa TaxID=46433 RepID=X6PAK9_RETFI|nr:hypothetical protein RFI_02407 [Reticulomyxa filosa]|eukprot:ETO34682.1 hypothetical protein RFI_02407 [Reticulomyxa filosa]
MHDGPNSKKGKISKKKFRIMSKSENTKRLQKVVQHLQAVDTSGDNRENVLDSRIHYEVLKHLTSVGHAPDVKTLHNLCGSKKYSLEDINSSLDRLEEGHGLVLHPKSDPKKIWIIHPFSTTPTLFWVSKSDDEKNGWFAPCIWFVEKT